MIQKFESDRRILTSPAIHPCDGISSTTLLASLITLARSICEYRAKKFTSQRRIAKEMIRQVEVLLMFLEEIRVGELVLLPHPLVLCFFELHLAFQKINHLLEDCTREEARLWILMKSKRVSAEFQVLIRTIATALDVVPFASLDLPVEIKEVVQLVAKQAQKSRFEVDPDDEGVMLDVISVLNQFETGVSPNPIDLKRVLHYLEIRSWSLCSKEVKFLEEELGFKGEKKEIEQLYSLLGFLNYCRAVMFDVVDRHGSLEHHVDERQAVVVVDYLNPEDFRCPISLEIMKDPVTVATGQTYDRPSILKWFKAGNLTCPKTGEKLASKELVPNSLLQKLIQQFCLKNGVQIGDVGNRNRDITKTIHAGSSAAQEAMRLISQFLANTLATGAFEDRNKAAYEVRLLAKSNIFNRSCLLKAGTIPLLLNLLSSNDASIQENAMAALLNLSKHPKSKPVIVENGGLILILDVLTEGLSLESRQLAAATLFYLSSVEEYRKLIGEIPEAMPALVNLIGNGSPRGKKNAVVAIFGLLVFPGNSRRVLDAGAVPLLVDLLKSPERSELLTDSLAVLATLADCPDGTFAILCTSALPKLIGILHSSSSRSTKEYCVSIIHSLCLNGGMEVVANLQKSSSLMASLYSLLTDGTSRASKKAATILNMLHGFNNTNSSPLLTSEVAQERSVHVQ